MSIREYAFGDLGIIVDVLGEYIPILSDKTL